MFQSPDPYFEAFLSSLPGWMLVGGLILCVIFIFGIAWLMTIELPRRMSPAPAVPSHQQRVIQEKAELDDKLSRLNPFLQTASFRALPDAEQDRLLRQRAIMRQYSSTLAERIAAFPPSSEH